MAQRRVQLLQLGAQVLPRGLPGDAGNPRRARTPRRRSTRTSSRWTRGISASRTWPRTTCIAPSAAPASCAARTRSSRATSTASASARSTSSRRCERSPSTRASISPAGSGGTSSRTSGERARARRDARLPGARRRLGPGLDLPVGGETVLFCDCEAAFYRTSPAARSRADPAGSRRRVRADARAMVLRRPRRRDGLRRPGASLRRAQRRRLAGGRREADPRARPARLHRLHRGLPALLRRRLRLRDRARRRARRGAAARRQARAHRADRADRHLPRCVPAQQAQGHPPGAARDPARDPRPDVQGRRPRDAVVVLLRRRRGAPDRAPDLTAEISRRRVERASPLEVDTLVSACVWSERPLGEQGRRRPRSRSSI